MSQHQKHAKITRPVFGAFHRNEWAILGTTCSRIKQLAYALTEIFQSNYRVGYVDADHKNADGEPDSSERSAMNFGATKEYTDKITHHQFNFKGHLDNYQYRNHFLEEDFVLVNGNHFEAKRQIVVIDPVKEKSLKKRLAQLKQVDLILFTEQPQPLYPFLVEAIPGIDGIPILNLDDIAGISQFIRQQVEVAKPPLFGLVLAGGKSQRMGQDKGLIDYHGQPQREHIAQELAAFCEGVYISGRENQEISSEFPSLPDTFTGLGPYGGILSAFRAHPDAAWLVVACDLPLLDQRTLGHLVSARNISKLATAFNSPVNTFPEPLIAIWEPRAYVSLLQFLAQGYSCPRKVLINTDVELVDAQNPQALMNVNRPEEYEQVMAVLNNL